MRLRVVGLLVALGALLVACGGGGKSMLPSIAQPAASAATPGQQATKRLAVTLKIPPASQQSKARRPYYLSPNTQSIAFAVLPNGSGTPTPSELQVFPVTTPSPCATTGAGGETCTFNVSAPYGTDIFYVATFAVASPNPASTTVPLASFVSGAIVISSPGPGPTPSPLAFDLNGILTSVVLTVPSPDPNNTPNTQVLVAASPTSLPLGITPYDSSGAPILADTFLAPIPIIVTPQSQGVGLAFTATCPTSSGTTANAPIVDIGCAADLANVQIFYPGTIFADASDHIVDTFSIAASQMASPAPSPANVVLASEITSFAPPGGSSYNQGYLQTLPNNTLAYMLMSTSLTTAEYGTIDAVTGATTNVTLNGTTPGGFYTMSDGSIWVTDTPTDSLLCFMPGSGTVANSVSLSSFMTTPSNVTFDGTKIWVSGSIPSPAPSPDVVAYAPLTSTCATGALTSSSLSGNMYQDTDLLMAPQSGGGVLINGVADGGAWTVTSGGAVTLLYPGFTPGNAFGGGVGIDGTATGYFAFNNGTQGELFNLASGGLSFNASPLVVLPPIRPGALAAFGPNGGAADRIGYADTTNQTLGIIEGPNGSTPVQILTTLGYVQFGIGQNVAISTGGAGFVTYYNENAAAMLIARTYFTTTWWIPVTTLPLNNVLSIDERGDSGPFTLTPVGTPPACYSSITAVPNTDHDFYIHTLSGPTCGVTLTVTDRNGRSQTVNVTAQYNAG